MSPSLTGEEQFQFNEESKGKERKAAVRRSCSCPRNPEDVIVLLRHLLDFKLKYSAENIRLLALLAIKETHGLRSH